jgi:PhnB protein
MGVRLNGERAPRAVHRTTPIELDNRRATRRSAQTGHRGLDRQRREESTMSKTVKPIPDGFRTITPYLTLRDAAPAIDFYKKAFGAQEVMRMPGPEGKGVMHAELRIGDSMLFLSDELPHGDTQAPESLGGATGSVFLYVPDVDATFNKAVQVGAKAIMPPADMFWGDRFAKLVDPFGHHWGLATHKEEVPPDEMSRRAKEAMKQMAS